MDGLNPVEGEALGAQLPTDPITPQEPAAPLTLRETLEAAVEAKQETPNPDKPGRTANRLRDDSGKLLPGTKVAAPASPNPSEAANLPSPASPVAATPQRPPGWKKEYWEKYDKIAQEDPQLASYLIQREREFQSGVSTYRGEAESAKHLNEAIAPFMPNLQKHGIEPGHFIRSLGAAHERLAMGSPQEKILMGAQLLKEYNIDLQGLYNFLTNPQYAQQVQQTQAQPQFDPRTINTTVQQQVEQALASREIKSEYEKFVSAKDKPPSIGRDPKQSVSGLPLQVDRSILPGRVCEKRLRKPLKSVLAGFNPFIKESHHGFCQ